MFERFNTPEDIFSFKLGSALSMEHDTLDMLLTMQQKTPRHELLQLFREHEEETRQQITNLERCFSLIGEDVGVAPSPTTKGLVKEARSTIGKTDARLVDAVLLAGGLEAEHYEIAVYETLIINAKARGALDVAALLQQNYDQEVAAAAKIRDAAARIANEGIAVDAPPSPADVPEVPAASVTAAATGVVPADSAAADEVAARDRDDAVAQEGVEEPAGTRKAGTEKVGTEKVGTEKLVPLSVVSDEAIRHPFDQTNGLADGLEGDSDGTADSDNYSAADRSLGRPIDESKDREGLVP
jgi:ferritin-like metal-binding protein YciE